MRQMPDNTSVQPLETVEHTWSSSGLSDQGFQATVLQSDPFENFQMS